MNDFEIKKILSKANDALLDQDIKKANTLALSICDTSSTFQGDAEVMAGMTFDLMGEPDMARIYYHRASKNGNSQADFIIGRSYFFSGNEDEGFKYLKRSSDAGNAFGAITLLPILLFHKTRHNLEQAIDLAYRIPRTHRPDIATRDKLNEMMYHFMAANPEKQESVRQALVKAEGSFNQEIIARGSYPPFPNQPGMKPH